MEEIVKYIVIGTVAIVALNYLGKFFTILNQFLSAKLEENKYRKYAKEYIKKQNELIKIPVPVKFYGLFEFQLKNSNDEVNLKKDFCSMIKEKIKTKYKNINMQINATDKIFFNCSDFSKIDVLIDDFIKLYNFFVDINKKRNIKTDLKFSIYAKAGDINKQTVYKMLSEINSLSFENQIVANDEIYKQYKKQGLSFFSFDPRGLIKLVENDEEIELYRLVKNKY